jgi:uncharacterized membrane protein YbhN (UPF0104 family)
MASASNAARRRAAERVVAGVERLPHHQRIESREALRWRGYARGPRPVLTIGLLALGGVLLWRHLRELDWRATREVLHALPTSALAAAAALSALSYLVYCSFDLLGRRTTGHRLDGLRVMAIAFVGHACALSLGPAGAGVRFRLAMRHGLPVHLTAALWLFNVATNWLGFVTLAGVGFATRAFTWPGHWGVHPAALQLIGWAMLGVVAVYVLACGFGGRLSFTLRGMAFRLPPAHVALAQCGLSALNWLLLAAVVHALLGERVAVGDVLGALMASALALAIVDVPAGLGVTESVFITLLGGQLPAAQILAALVAYRAIYFVAPLALASLVYLGMEWDAHGRTRGAGTARHPGATLSRGTSRAVAHATHHESDASKAPINADAPPRAAFTPPRRWRDERFPRPAPGATRPTPHRRLRAARRWPL